MNRKIQLFIAMSLDGYITGPDGDISWLFTDQDYGITKFIEGVDTLIMGRKSYDAMLALGWMYEGKKIFVYTRRTQNPDGQNVTFTSLAPEKLMEDIRRQPGKNIWLFGGGEVVKLFLDAALVDEMVVAIHPVVLGGGAPLFPQGVSRTNLGLVRSESFDSGLLIATYLVS
ncbi:MAG: dihydrofolate reductase [Nitrospinae bacterium]|nr:dihydrofolate reductase [Nitrospinota bacterium]